MLKRNTCDLQPFFTLKDKLRNWKSFYFLRLTVTALALKVAEKEWGKAC